MLYTAIVNLLSVHFKLLQENFRTIRSRSAEKLSLNSCPECLQDPEDLQVEMRRELVKCIKHLQRMFKYFFLRFIWQTYFFCYVQDLRASGAHLHVLDSKASPHIPRRVLHLSVPSFFGKNRDVLIIIKCRNAIFRRSRSASSSCSS